jgi:outer membrane protein assembly factor BamA
MRMLDTLAAGPVAAAMALATAAAPVGAQANPGAGARPAADTTVAAVDAAVDTVRAPRSWLILPAIFYTPETELGGGIAVAHYPEGGVGRRPSSLLALFTVTTRRQAVLQLVPDVYLAGGRTRLQGSLTAQEFPDFFYGIGNTAPVSAEEEYTARTFAAELTARRELLPDAWLGVRLLARHDDLTEVEEGGLLEDGGVPGADGGATVGLGVNALLDTRESPFAPRSGEYLEAEVTTFGPELGSDYRFSRARLDGRLYRPLGERVVLAAQTVVETAAGDAPFPFIPAIGGGDLLRGYRAGRFRDDRLAAAQAEIRFPIWKRIGGVVFGAVGDVAAEWDAFPAVGDLERSVGVGLRYRLTAGGVNLRADWAEGRGTRGLYMGFGEAF